MRLIAGLFLGVLLASCGGSGGGGGTTPTSTTLAAMVDSLGRTVPENDFGGGDGGAAGADGSAGDGAPIANAPVVLTDNAGHTAKATTDAQGYYRTSIKGFTPPFVVQVTRNDGTLWYSHSTAPVQTRGFVTINLTGLTDKVGGYVAAAANVSGGAAGVTPAVLAANAAALQTSKVKIAASLAAPLTGAGVDPSGFDPVSSRYQAVEKDNYDKLLQGLAMSKVPSDGNTLVVGTLAGAQACCIDGPTISASFSQMSGVAVDASGNVFVADTQNSSIRKITPQGVVSTLAGGGIAGYVDGTGSAARFSRPTGVAVDSSGNVFVADRNNHVIRKVSAAGVVSTFAGTGNAGLTNGTGTAASFRFPEGVAVDTSGNVFVADTWNDVIRKISPLGVVSTLAGTGSRGTSNGVGAVASFYLPTGLAVDISGNVFVAQRYNHIIRKITAAGVVSTFAGGGDAATGYPNGTGTSASFDSPSGIAVDKSGNVYVADSSNHAVRKITASGAVSTIAGNRKPGFVNGSDISATFNSPLGVTVDSSGNVLIADTLNRAIRSISTANVVSTLAGGIGLQGGFTNGARTAASFSSPSSIAVDISGNVFVADTGNNVIRKITTSGVVSTFAGSGSLGFSDGKGTAASFNNPAGIAVDSGGNVLVADTGNRAIRKISPEGIVGTVTLPFEVKFYFEDGPTGPTGVAVDGDGNLFILGRDLTSVFGVTPQGQVFYPATSLGYGHSALAMALDNDGNLYIASCYAIVKVPKRGRAFPLIDEHSGGAFIGCDGGGLAVDNGGNVFFSNPLRSEIFEFPPSGTFKILAGLNGGGYINGPSTLATFNGPRGLSLDRFGNLIVADTGNNAIRFVLP
jgi:sugar lactone lactonase YvrE